MFLFLGGIIMKVKQVSEDKIKECSKTLIEFCQTHQYTQMEMSALLRAFDRESSLKSKTRLS